MLRKGGSKLWTTDVLLPLPLLLGMLPLALLLLLLPPRAAVNGSELVRNARLLLPTLLLPTLLLPALLLLLLLPMIAGGSDDSSAGVATGELPKLCDRRLTSTHNEGP